MARIFHWEYTNLRDLRLTSNIFVGITNDIEQFFRGVNRNRSIHNITFLGLHIMGGEIFQSLRPYFENNNNLSELDVERCTFGAGCSRQLSLALRGCAKSLKCVKFWHNRMGNEPLVDIIEAFSVHPQLEKLELVGMNVGRSECRAILVLLLRADIELQELNLSGNDIDDEGVDDLASDLSNNSSLRVLRLSSNRNITARGYLSLAAQLENPNCNLEVLNLSFNNIDNEGALILANALPANCKLNELNLVSYSDNNGITAEGWSNFAKVLCDTSSINNTFLSNHTLENFGIDTPADVKSLLTLNRSSEDKSLIAIRKILRYHQHFDMQPFFEWDLKVLPIAINWFDRARTVDDNNAGTDKHKLGAIYQFIRAMPEAFE